MVTDLCNVVETIASQRTAFKNIRYVTFIRKQYRRLAVVLFGVILIVDFVAWLIPYELIPLVFPYLVFGGILSLGISLVVLVLILGLIITIIQVIRAKPASSISSASPE